MIIPPRILALALLPGSRKAGDDGTIRCSDVYHRDAVGHWPIVNEHCSAMPAAT